MVFTIHHHESATGIYVSPHPEPLLPSPSLPYPSGVSQSTSFSCLASCTELALVMYFTYGKVRVSVLFS